MLHACVDVDARPDVWVSHHRSDTLALQEIFAMFDEDRDGVLAQSEYRYDFQSYAIRFTPTLNF